jgi:GNAT superfamily N-acetyltransferase
MARLEIHPLSELRDAAATLLRERFLAQRALEPLLPEVDDFEPHVPEEGHVATRSGEPVAYLGGAVEAETQMARWLFAGHAAREPEALLDLFAVQAEKLDVARFMLTVPASAPELIDVWFRLGFGCQAVWAVQEVSPVEPVDFGGTIRIATPDDIEAFVDFSAILYGHQAAAPSFSEFATPSREQLREEVAVAWDGSDTYVPFVAEHDGTPTGLLGLYRRPAGDLRVPAYNIDLAFAATRSEVRGSGTGLALTAFAMKWAHDHGYRSMTVDWRSVNLLSSRFWPSRGFRPQYLRLYRAVP